MSYKASAPGSLMLLGEHAVLLGKPALLAAVDARMQVILTPRTDRIIEIDAPGFGHYETTLDELTIEKPFQFVLGTLLHFRPKMRFGCRLDITSDFSATIGFGSSAAVTVATLAAIVSWLGIRMAPLDVIRQGRAIIRQVQGVGSGADVAASVYGGLVAFQNQPLQAEKIAATYPLTAIYCGYKTPTVDVIAKVQAQFQPYPNLFRAIAHAIGQCAQEGIGFAKQQQWGKLGDVMHTQQGLMEALGVSNPLLRAIVDDLMKQSPIIGAKISGSGLGDCVVGLGHVDQFQLPSHPDVIQIPVAMSLQGVHCEKT